MIWENIVLRMGIIDASSIIAIQNQYYETDAYGKVAADTLVLVKDGQIQPFFRIVDFIEIQPNTCISELRFE